MLASTQTTTNTVKAAPKPKGAKSAAKQTKKKTNAGYECILVLHPHLDDDTQKNLLNKLKTVFQDHGGQLQHDTTWERRRLAYPIQKQLHGYYHLFYLSQTPAALHALEKQLRIEEQVLRWLSVSVADMDAEFTAFEKMKAENAKSQQEIEPAPKDITSAEDSPILSTSS